MTVEAFSEDYSLSGEIGQGGITGEGDHYKRAVNEVRAEIGFVGID